MCKILRKGRGPVETSLVEAAKQVCKEMPDGRLNQISQQSAPRRFLGTVLATPLLASSHIIFDKNYTIDERV